MTTFREAFWNEDWLDLENLPGDSFHAICVKSARLRELGIKDPNAYSEGYPDTEWVGKESYSYRPDLVREHRIKATHAVYGDRLTNQQWWTIRRCFDDRCAYCGLDGPIFRDHVISIASGGPDIWSNVVPACKSCNSKKHALSLEKWLSKNRDVVRQRYLKGVQKRDSALGGR